MNFLEQLIELRETFYVVEYWFVIEGYDAGAARWRRCIGQGMGKGTELPRPLQVATLSAPSHINQPESSLTPDHLGFCGDLMT